MTSEEARSRAAKRRPEKRQTPDRELDLSDVPELTTEQLRRAKRVGPGRPPLGSAARKMISIKLDPELLADLKRKAKDSGKPYQSLIHEILQKHVKGNAA